MFHPVRRFWLWTLLPILAVPGCAPRPNSEPIWVGHLAPLSGPNRAVGEQARQAIQLSVSEGVAEDKKVTGRSVAVLHVDSRNDEETVRAETIRLISVNKVTALIGSLDATLAERMGREAQPFGIPLIVTGEAAGGLRIEGILPLGVSANFRGQLLARLVMEKKPSSIAIASDSRSSVAGDLVAAFAREARKDKAVTIVERTFEGDPDKTDWLEDLTRDKPGALLLACSAPVFSRLHGVLRKQDFKGTLIYGGEDVGGDSLPRIGDMEILLATVSCTEGLTSRGQEFARKFEETFHETPGYAAFQAYDAERLLLDTLQQSNSAGSLRLRDRLMKLETFETLTGPLTFKDRQTRRPVFLLQLKGRERKLLKTVPLETEG